MLAVVAVISMAVVALGALLVLARQLDNARIERHNHRVEIQTLLQRIQAPEAAVIQHQVDGAGPEMTVPLSDHEAARAQADAVLHRIAEMERLELEGVPE